MITINAKIVEMNITPANPQADPPTVETCAVKVERSPPDGAGLCRGTRAWRSRSRRTRHTVSS
jgi:hypothetical protein